jgi:hypothetical protein
LDIGDNLSVIAKLQHTFQLVRRKLAKHVLVEVFPGSVIAVASRPDAALSKLIWIQRGSQKSRRDLRQIVRRLSADELALLRTRALQMQLAELLDSVLAESDEIIE